MPLMLNKIFNPARKIAAMPRIDENDSFQLDVNEIAPMAISAALAEIGREGLWRNLIARPPPMITPHTL